MSKSTLIINAITATGSETLGTSYNTTDVIAVDMASTQPFQPSKMQFAGIIEALHFKLTGAAGGAAKLTMKVCLDAAGDHCIIPSTEATLEAGVTTAGTMCCSFSVNTALAQTIGNANATLYVFAKVDAGSATFAECTITWRE
tara:strand:+ start:725 stop:1153 length:429 start_codon:yes stop_codon:yes gene_type:complete